MPKQYSSYLIIKTLQRKSFVFISQSGSHMKFKKDSCTVIVPANKKEIPIGTFRSIVRQSALDIDDFL